jgi:RHS repeat-associated protein
MFKVLSIKFNALCLCLREFGGHLDLEYKYIYANGLLLARYDETPADTHYYHHDGLGSVMGMTAKNASVEQSYFYDEFGNSLGDWGPVTNHYLYTGQEYDGSISALYNLRARYYDRRIGRFVSEDPMMLNIPLKVCSDCGTCIPGHRDFIFERDKNPQNFNLYTYVANNPINYLDPSGLSRYKMCERHTGTARDACYLLVWLVCHSEFGLEWCCKQDLMNCLERIPKWEEEEREYEEALCYFYYLLCLGQSPSLPEPPK